MRRSLTFFWRIHLSVLLGVAVATAVLTGALLVGDSVRDSLKDLTLDRLGDIDHALVSDRFFRADLARDIEAAGDGMTVVPAVTLGGSAVHAGAGTRASRVAILGVNSRFAGLFDANPPDLARHGAATPFIANESLRSELNARVGDAVLLSFELPGTSTGNRCSDVTGSRSRYRPYAPDSRVSFPTGEWVVSACARASRPRSMRSCPCPCCRKRWACRTG